MWRNLERGYELRKGIRFDIAPRPETVANAARAVGITVDMAFQMADIEIELAQDFAYENVDLTGVPHERLLEELRRRLAAGAPPTAEEIEAHPERYTVIGRREPKPDRKTGP
ncbi:hypothetical protein AOZ06_12890 [Kibdelosporangium phytohabitans]|uniref:Uncharacterized protein n=2 Tax=Kibdelosporangium phytohabitans TaxID=860235 RepID=A0A0N9HM41_9PSEU|nr:hypothetical protein AOZ06_12570 [Kibdelosporangium phytohabitans]ALG07684.1 hypothetical protein AOZ06_12890 [Kibdelosporangium phytohabitans]